MNEKERIIAEGKLLDLQNILVNLGMVAVAFSGGVDSALLLAVAHNVLDQKAIAITAVSRAIPAREQHEAGLFCNIRGIRQLIYDFNELMIPEFRNNPIDRCYYCKRALFTGLIAAVAAEGKYILVEGSNADDMNDYRPGLRAIHELKIISPLKEVGLNKAEIRYLAHKLGLVEWNKPSYACLASRFPYGEQITEEALSRVELAENLLYELGLRQFRVRVHGTLARIEVLPEDMTVIMENRVFINDKFKLLGFAHTSLDLCGYCSGSMNVGLKR